MRYETVNKLIYKRSFQLWGFRNKEVNLVLCKVKLAYFVGFLNFLVVFVGGLARANKLPWIFMENSNSGLTKSALQHY